MRKLFFTVLVIFYGLQINAQNNNLVFDFDYAQFGYDSVSNYVEFYYSFNQGSMEIAETDTASVIEGILSINILDTTKNEILVDKEWKIVHQVRDSLAENKSLVGVIGFIIPEGVYRAIIGGRDAVNLEHKKNITEFLNVSPLWKEKISLSDIELSTRIIQNSPNDNSIFYKNSFEVYPSPTSVFGENQPVVFYYSELYNLKSENPDKELKLTQSIFNSRGNLVSSKTKVMSTTIDSRVEVGSIVVNKFPTDTYTLVLSLIDSVENYGVSSSKRFFIYNPSVEIIDTSSGGLSGILASEFGVMSEEELDDLFEKARYLANSNEIDQYDKLSNAEGKREFLFDFWKRRDEDLTTKRNETYTQFLNRVNASNQRFGSLGKDGWKTDRGRVYILHGEPSEIERYPNQIDTKPYEIWYYNEIEGGVVFVFADLTGFSDYMLLHSTMRGELRDDNWQRRITSF